MTLTAQRVLKEAATIWGRSSTELYQPRVGPKQQEESVELQARELREESVMMREAAAQEAAQAVRTVAAILERRAAAQAVQQRLQAGVQPTSPYRTTKADVVVA